MGGVLTSRRNPGVEEVDISNTNAYRYPPKSGCYFGSHFIMGGERFETTQPEAFLFGENQDLNFLGSRPIPFPYPPPQAHEPTKTLKSLINIRKDSLKFIRVDKPETSESPEDPDLSSDGPQEEDYSYNLEFLFDTDVRVAITIYYFATEEIINGQAVYHPRDPTMNSETFHYKRGANQMFSQSTHIIQPGKFPEEDWQYNPDKDLLPVVIHCVVEDEPEQDSHSHITLAIIEKIVDGGYVMKALKQKQMVDGLCYLLQEIYGIENKSSERNKLLDDEIDDTGSECVICMCEVRDTLILPCRHLCLCNGCADNLRYQANNCPICRSPFRALLQIRAMRKKMPNSPPPVECEDSVSQEGVPTGYEAVSLIKALNGSTVSTNHDPLSPPPEGLSPDLDKLLYRHDNDTDHDETGLPATPEQSPLVRKKRSVRRSSSRSQRSFQQESVSAMEEGCVDLLNRKTCRDQATDMEQDSEAGRRTSPQQIRYPSSKMVLVPHPDLEEGAAVAIDALENDCEDEDRDIPPPDYDVDQSPDEHDDPLSPAAHLGVLYSSGQDDADGRPGSQHSLCLPALPGTPVVDTAGYSSSGSSSGSSKGLLPLSLSNTSLDDKPVV